MNYVYDVLANFKYPFIDFYEWNNDDKILNIKKIPFIKVTSETLNILKYHKFKINIDNVRNLVKVYNKKKMYNGIIYTDGREAIAFNFDNKGICIGKSSIMLLPYS